MSAQVLFKSNDITVTPTVARFGGVSYQIANIGSVSIFIENRLRTLTFVLALVAGVVAIFGLTSPPPQDRDAFMIAMFLATVAFFWQAIFWRRKLTLILKTSSGDIQAYETFNRAYIFQIKDAIEAAFDQRVSWQGAPLAPAPGFARP